MVYNRAFELFFRSLVGVTVLINNQQEIMFDKGNMISDALNVQHYFLEV